MRWNELRLAVILVCTSHQCVEQVVADSGRIVIVNDRRVHVVVEGQGQPTVVFEAGFVNDLRSWAKVQAEIVKSCTTVSYDRAGLGLSEESSSPRSGEQIAADLRALLQKLSTLTTVNEFVLQRTFVKTGMFVLVCVDVYVVRRRLG